MSKQRAPQTKRAATLRRSLLATCAALLLGAAPGAGCKSDPKPDEGISLKDPEPSAASDETDTSAADAGDKSEAAAVKPAGEAEAALAIPGGPPPLRAKPPVIGRRPELVAGHTPPVEKPAEVAVVTSTGTEPPPTGAMQAPPTPAGEGDGAAEPAAAGVPGSDTPVVRPAPMRPAPMPVEPVEPTEPEVAPALAGVAPPPGTPGTPARTPRVVPAPSEPPLDIERYLPLEVVREIVGEGKIMPTGPLAGLPSTPSYNSAHFTPPGGTRFGASLQVWHDPSRLAINERFRRAKRQYPHAQDTRALDPAKAFFSYFGKIQTLTFMDSDKQLIISVACAEDVCTQEKLLKLAKHARQAM